MKLLYTNKFIFWNLIALVFVKAVFSYSGLQLANIIDGVAGFTKDQVVSQTNIFRSSFGLKELRTNPVLDQAASKKLQDMVNGQYFAHTSPSGVSPWYWFDESQYEYTYAGENLAIGFVSAESTVDAWANSPSHRENLLNSKYTEVGIAVAPAKIDNSNGFLVVQLFGTPRPNVVAVAQPPREPTPTPIQQTPQTSPTPQQMTGPAAVVGSSTENQPPALESPIAVDVSGSTPQVQRVSGILNKTLIFYALAIFLASLAYMLFAGARKELVIRTAGSFAILLLAVLIPVIQASRTALII